MVAALLGMWSLVSYQVLHTMQHRLACDTSLRISSCTHGGSFAWHMVPRFVSGAACMQHRLAWDASLHNQWLHARPQHRLARGASLRTNGCTHGSSIPWWHMVPRFVAVAACNVMQHRLARDAPLQNQWRRTWPQHRLAHAALVQISNGCTHGGSIA